MKNTRAIRNDEDLAWAIAEVEQYFVNGPDPGSAEADRFDVLSVLIEAYEDEHYPIDAPEPIEFLKAHMAMLGRKQSDLAKLLDRRRAPPRCSTRSEPLPSI